VQYRLVTLLEILRAYASKYMLLVSHLDTANVRMGVYDIWQDHLSRQELVGTLKSLHDICLSHDFPVTKTLAEKIIAALTDPKPTAGSELLQRYLFDLRNRFIDEAGAKIYLQIPFPKMPYFDSPTIGWEVVVGRFRDSIGDVEEMGRCFALSRYGGAVFHSLLVAEHGLIELGKEIGAADHKTGWDATCRQMKTLLDGGHPAYPEQLRVTFNSLEQINSAAQSMKLAWRNKVNHAAGRLVVMASDFVPDVAEEIIFATRAFMRRLATDLPQRDENHQFGD
jgi:hypothetical protein